MRCCGVTVSVARRFILTWNVATAYVWHKQLRIKAPVHAALLLFFPKHSNKSLEKHYAPKEATPRKHQGKREKIGCIHQTRPSGTVSCHSLDPAAAWAWDRSMTMKRMRTNKRIFFFCLWSSCWSSRYSCNTAKYSTTQQLHLKRLPWRTKLSR